MALKAAPPPAFAGSGRGQKVILVSVVAAIGGFLFGYDTAVINGAVDAIKAQFGAGDLVLGLTVAAALIGSAAGAWIAGPIADRAGRIRVMVLASFLFAVSSLATGLAGVLALVAAWRFVSGVAIGIASVIAPTYIAEVAPAHLRGRLGSLQQLAIVVGIFVALLVDFAIADIAGGASNQFELGFAAWRWMFWAAVIPSILYGALALLIPESPRFLVSSGREREAEEVIRDIIGGDARAKVAEIRHTVATERHPRLRDLRGPRFGLLPIVWTGIGLSMFQQLVGINVIFYYSSTLWHAVGFTERSSLLITVITSVTNIVTTFIAIALIDRVGRRPLLMAGSAGMTVSLGTMALVFGTARVGPTGPELGAVTGPVALVAANLFVVFFGFSWGPVVWVLLGEMFPNRIRAVALSVSASAQWLTNYLVTATFPSLKSTSLGLAYGIYTASALLSLLFVASLVRETRGKELEQM